MPGSYGSTLAQIPTYDSHQRVGAPNLTLNAPFDMRQIRSIPDRAESARQLGEDRQTWPCGDSPHVGLVGRWRHHVPGLLYALYFNYHMYQRYMALTLLTRHARAQPANDVFTMVSMLGQSFLQVSKSG